MLSGWRHAVVDGDHAVVEGDPAAVYPPRGSGSSTWILDVLPIVFFWWGGRGGREGRIFLYGFFLIRIFLIRIFAYETFVHILMDLLPEMYQKTSETLRNTIFRPCGARICLF